MKKTIALIWIPLLSFSMINAASANYDHKDARNIKTIEMSQKDYDNIELLPNITYGVAGSKEISMHLLAPKNTKKQLPLIIYIQGGGWGKNHPQKSFSFIPKLVQFANSGYVVASVEHRTSHDAKFPAQLHDVKAAVRFLRANAKQFHINPNKIGVWGSSSGGHLAALLGTSGGVSELEGQTGNLDQSSRVQAVVDWYGPTDLLQMSKFPSKVDFDSPNSPESFLIGGPLQQNKEKVKKANPITYVSQDDPPFLIMHGDKDQRVPFNQSILLYDALRNANVSVEMYKVKGAGHGGKSFSQPETLKLVKNFFDKNLKQDSNSHSKIN